MNRQDSVILVLEKAKEQGDKTAQVKFNAWSIEKQV